ncbi:hypothetical protein EDEG_01658, partial [Edhazardia aedis USNM 41457]
MLRKFLWLMHIAISKECKEEEIYDGIICYNVDPDCPEIAFFLKIDNYIKNICSIIISKERREENSLVLCNKEDFFQNLTNLIYKNVLFYHYVNIMCNFSDFIFSDANSQKNSSKKNCTIVLTTKHIFQNDISF